MLNRPEELTDNRSFLLRYRSDRHREVVLGYCDVIAAQRPLRTSEEASYAAHEVNNILACLEHGLEASDNHPTDSEAVNEGLRIILESCRLVNLRVEQYIDLQIDKENELNQKNMG